MSEKKDDPGKVLGLIVIALVVALIIAIVIYFAFGALVVAAMAWPPLMYILGVLLVFFMIVGFMQKD